MAYELPDPTNPYGIDVLLTPDGDLAVGPGGGLAFVQGPQNVVQAMTLRLRTWPNELPLHPEYGNPIERALVGAKAGDLERARVEARLLAAAIVRDDRRIRAARNITATKLDASGKRVQISMQLVLVDGQQLQVTDLAELTIEDADVENVDLDGFVEDDDAALDELASSSFEDDELDDDTSVPADYLL